MRLKVRRLGGSPVELGIAGGLWVEPQLALGGDFDLSAFYSLPGLADAHLHLSADRMDLEAADLSEVRRRAFAAVEGGVFLGLDKGWCDEVVLAILDDPREVRPDLQASGRMITAPGGYYPGFTKEVGDDELAAAVAEAASRSNGWVKIVGDWPRKGLGALPNFTEEALTAAVGVAHRAGARVAIHTMARDVPSMAVRAGVDSIEHGLFLTDADVRALGERGGAWVPTVVNVEAIIEQLGPESSGGVLLSEGLDRVRQLLPGAVAAGVAVLAGSDLALPHGQIGREVERLVSYGLAEEDAVAAASEHAFRYAGVEAGFRAGLPADLVAFAADPREQVAALSDPQLVIRNGSVLSDPGGMVSSSRPAP